MDDRFYYNTKKSLFGQNVILENHFFTLRKWSKNFQCVFLMCRERFTAADRSGNGCLTLGIQVVCPSYLQQKIK
jgi:hypothetical protein